MKDFVPVLIFSAVILAGLAWTHGDSYFTEVFITTCLFGTFAVAWNLSAGIAGLLSLGHSLFFGLGAYSVVFGLSRYGLSSWVTWPIAVLLSVLLAAIIGGMFFRYRVKGYFFSIGTLAFAEVGFLLVSATPWLGRSDGMILPARGDTFLYWQFMQKWPYAIGVSALLILTLVVSALMLRTRIGFYWRAIRDNEDAAESLGVPTNGYKILSLVISAAIAAVCGAFYANYYAFVDPRSTFGVELSIQLLVFAIIGGMRFYWGPLLGAMLLVPLTEVLRAYAGVSAHGLNLIVYALLVIVLALKVPQGLAGLITRRAAAPRAGH